MSHIRATSADARGCSSSGYAMGLPSQTTMAKLKTKKSAIKRFKVTATGKILHRPMHQDHFNARDTGKQRRLKRRWIPVAKAEAKMIRKLLPYV